MIHIMRRDLQTLRREAADGYPEEVCGALLGSVHGDTATVQRVIVVSNARQDQRRRRYLIGPDEIRELEDAADAAGLDVVGFYHSHPDHPAIPSDFDREHAWPWYRYVIVPVAHGLPGDARAWLLSEDRAVFHEVGLEVEADAPLQEAV